MQRSSLMKTWGLRVLTAVALVAVCVALGLLLSSFNILTIPETVFAALMFGFGAALTLRQMKISKQLKQLNAQSWDIAEYEKGLNHQIQKAAQRTTTASQKNTSLIEEQNKKYEIQFRKINERLDQLDLKAVRVEAPALDTPDSDKPHDAANAPETKTRKSPVAKPKKDVRIASALDGDTLRLHLQPIVELPSRTPVFFQTAMRLQTGENQFMGAEEFDQLARAGGLMPAIDIKVLFSSVRMVRTLRKMKKQSGITCNISKHTLAQLKSFKTIFEYLEANSPLKQALIFSITQADFYALSDKEHARLDKIADLGFSLSLTKIVDLDLEPEPMAAQGFKYAVVSIDLFSRSNIGLDGKKSNASELMSSLRAHEISLIVTNTDQENQAIELIDAGVPYAQGGLFAPPRPVKPELLGR